jgi:hypothetical protein
MENLTLLLLKFWGFYVVIMVLILLFRPSIRDYVIELAKEKSFKLIAGFIALFLGLGCVLLHNVWGNELEIIVSFIGWSALVKGIINIGFPELSNSLIKKVTKKALTIYLIVALFLGIYMLVRAYGMLGI